MTDEEEELLNDPWHQRWVRIVAGAERLGFKDDEEIYRHLGSPWAPIYTLGDIRAMVARYEQWVYEYVHDLSESQIEEAYEAYEEWRAEEEMSGEQTQVDEAGARKSNPSSAASSSSTLSGGA